MDKYIIAKDVDVKKIGQDTIAAGGISNLVTGFGNASEKTNQLGLKAGGDNAFGFGFASPWGLLTHSIVSIVLAVINELRDKSIVTIRTTEDLKQYRNCTSDEWKKGVIYVEHPHKKNNLIEASLYKDYILREMIADLFDFITDHIEVSRLVIGLVDSKNVKGNAKIPVKSINAEATINCDLNSDYLFSVKNIKAVPDKQMNKQYVWINLFPDIAAAVNHGAGEMEVKKAVSYDFDIGGGLGKKFKAGVNAKNKYEFYVSFAQ